MEGAETDCIAALQRADPVPDGVIEALSSRLASTFPAYHPRYVAAASATLIGKAEFLPQPCEIVIRHRIPGW